MKIIICDGDKKVKKMKVENKFVFLVTDDKRVYHIDSADGNMYKAQDDLLNLCEAHKKMIEKDFKKMDKVKR